MKHHKKSSSSPSRKIFLRIGLILVYIVIVFLLYTPVKDSSLEIEFHSCYDINCSYALVSLLEEKPDHYCAFYDLEDEEIYSHVNEGVLFEDNYDETFSKLEEVGSKGLMHHKIATDSIYVKNNLNTLLLTSIFKY